jgi:L-threonylcarbamoyladenylate synthase
MPQVSLLEMVSALESGPALVSFPTDTVPALATCLQHTHLIYEAKRRPLQKPLILMGASLEDLLPYVTGTADEIDIWRSLTQKHWPGQLTLVLPVSDLYQSKSYESKSNEDLHTLGIRVPNHPIVIALLARTGPLATTSANLSGQPPLRSPLQITQTFPNALVLPTETFEAQATSGTPSTVAKWTGSGWEILRQGKIRL